MELFVFSNLAMLDLRERRPGDALSITEHVLEGRPGGRVGAIFAVRAARALAQGGESRRALDAVDRADVLLGEGITTGDPSWAWWFDTAELAWHRATAHAELGDWVAAVEGYREACETRSTIREAAGVGRPDRRRRSDFNDLAHLVDALVRIEEWPEVEDLMPEVLDYVGSIRSARTVRVLQRIVKQVHRCPTATSTVEDQVEQLDVALQS